MTDYEKYNEYGMSKYIYSLYMYQISYIFVKVDEQALREFHIRTHFTSEYY